MVGNIEIWIPTEELAYSFDTDVYPIIRVFEAPYVEGDCAIDEVLVDNISVDGWYANDGDTTRADISANWVRIVCDADNEYVIGKEYEIRIYRSDVQLDR